jgi:hypothetical protein
LIIHLALVRSLVRIRLTLLPVVFEAIKERFVACPMSFCFVQYNHIHAGKRGLMQAERFSHYALYSGSTDGQATILL